MNKILSTMLKRMKDSQTIVYITAINGRIHVAASKKMVWIFNIRRIVEREVDNA